MHLDTQLFKFLELSANINQLRNKMSQTRLYLIGSFSHTREDPDEILLKNDGFL